ncbi:type II toxin-antitoxin system Phd/YefM family antitoxin [Lichenicoccus sp.]|uniref:type II toxin-antitoxin system Phd/YefM family antitoxin n=1 Tax=Lichenicoccus sp. TaxID=2781899 RepID=UPI003D0FC089
MTTNTFNIHAAKTQFSKLVELAEAGDEVVIARDGMPVAKLIRFVRPSALEFGTLRGRLTAHEDFDDALSPEALIHLR